MAASKNFAAENTALLPELILDLQDGAGLHGLSARLSEETGGRAAVTDINGTLLAEAFCPACTPEQQAALRQLAGADSASGCALTLPLSFNGKRAGSLSVSRIERPFTEEDREVLSLAAGLFCVQLAQDKKIADIEFRLKGDFVADLISGRFADQESILSRARALDYDITAPHRVLVATIENLPLQVQETGTFRAEIVQLIQNRLRQTSKGMAVSGKNEFILLVRCAKNGDSIAESKALAETIIEEAATAYKAKMYIGIGKLCLTLDDFSQSYLEAKKALEIGEYMITEGQVRSFEQFKVHALFLSTLKPAELYNYAREQLDALLLYDQKHGTDFIKTLQEFLYLRNNVEGTAKSIGLSVSGLKYRLQKIEKILSHDLKDYKVCFDLQLALVILQLFGEYRV
jgi:purine catabolism regulator